MSRTLIISAAYVKQFSGVSASLDDELIRPVIDLAQHQHILPLLGGGLYDKVIADIDASTLAGDYATLVNTYVAPALVQWTLAEGLSDWTYRILGGAVGIRQSDNATQATNIEQLQDTARARARRYSLRCMDYVCREAAKFPEYGTEGAVNGLLLPTTMQDYTTGGLEIGTRRHHRELKRWQWDRRR